MAADIFGYQDEAAVLPFRHSQELFSLTVVQVHDAELPRTKKTLMQIS
ncbi:hypothetical protein [Sphingomonas crocodyli]|nr:hypothetical protein [Sphingomonas crocodyli]